MCLCPPPIVAQLLLMGTRPLIDQLSGTQGKIAFEHLEIMAEGRGTQFDSACLDAFLAYAEDQGLSAPSAESPEPEVPHVAAVGS